VKSAHESKLKQLDEEKDVQSEMFAKLLQENKLMQKEMVKFSLIRRNLGGV